MFESIRDLKSKIESEVRRHGRDKNVKVGRGGIREIEFIVQAMQLLRGVKSESVSNWISDALSTLMTEAIISENDGLQLKQDYLWLRYVEHVIQAEKTRKHRNYQPTVGLAAVLALSQPSFERKRREVTDRVHEAFVSFGGSEVTSDC